MRDAAGQLADRLHLLRLAQRLFGLAQGVLRLALGGDVAADRLQQLVRRDRAPGDAAARAVRRPQPSSNSLGAVPRRQRVERGSQQRAIFGNDEVQDVGADQLRLLPAQRTASRPG